MEIKKETLQLNRQIAHTATNFMVEGDVVAGDLFPDIREVLFCDAKAMCDSKTYKDGKLMLTGSVELHILYLPDEKSDSDALKSLSAGLPFVSSFDIPDGEHMHFSASVDIEHIGFHLVNSRKLSIKAIVSACVSGFFTETVSPICEIEDNLVETRKKKLKLDMPCVPAAKTITISDLLTVPTDFPDIDEIVKTQVRAYPDDIKPMNDKVMVKGTLYTNTLYNAYDGEHICVNVSHKIPFTEIFEVPGITEEHEVFVTFLSKNTLADAKGDLNGDTKIISFSTDLTAEISASMAKEIAVIDDCYAVSGSLNLDKQSVSLSEYILEENTEFTENITVKLPDGSSFGDLIFASCKPILRETAKENGALILKGTLSCFLLYREDGEHGALKSIITEAEFRREKPLSNQEILAENSISLLDIGYQKQGKDEAVLSPTLSLHTKLTVPATRSILTACEKTETENENKICPALTIYFVQAGDTLWNIAKKYGTTVNKIKNANGLKDDMLHIGRKLLIPKAC